VQAVAVEETVAQVQQVRAVQEMVEVEDKMVQTQLLTRVQGAEALVTTVTHLC
jgi:hypothetical protein